MTSGEEKIIKILEGDLLTGSHSLGDEVTRWSNKDIHTLLLILTDWQYTVIHELAYRNQ